VTDNRLIVRKQWLIAMAIVGVALLAIVFATCGTVHVGT